MPNFRASPQETPNGAKWEAKGAPREPKGFQRIPKTAPEAPKTQLNSLLVLELPAQLPEGAASAQFVSSAFPQPPQKTLLPQAQSEYIAAGN